MVELHREGSAPAACPVGLFFKNGNNWAKWFESVAKSSVQYRAVPIFGELDISKPREDMVESASCVMTSINVKIMATSYLVITDVTFK